MGKTLLDLPTGLSLKIKYTYCLARYDVIKNNQYFVFMGKIMICLCKLHTNNLKTRDENSFI